MAPRFEAHFVTAPLHEGTHHDPQRILEAIAAPDARAARLATKHLLDRVHEAYSIAPA